MKILGYRVTSRGPRSFEEIARWAYQLDLEDRFVPGDERGVRLEFLFERDQYLFLDFSKGRTGHGPGQRSRQDTVADIDLPNDGEFAEDTALVYDVESGYLALQYNHYGPRAKNIEEYLTSMDFSLGNLVPDQNGDTPYGYEFAVCLSQNAAARLNNIELYRDLEFSVALNGAQQSNLAAGHSLGRILDSPFPDGTETIKVTMKSARNRQGSMAANAVRSFIDGLRHLGEDVQNAKVHGKAADGSNVDPVDLIEDKLAATVSIPRTPGQRYSRDERWRHLAAQLRRWMESQQMPT